MAASTTTTSIRTVSTVLLAAIAIFAGIHFVGGSENHCSGSVCGDGNKGNTVTSQSPTATTPSPSKAK